MEAIVVKPTLAATATEIDSPQSSISSPAIVGEVVIVLWGFGCGIVFLVQLRRILGHRSLIRSGTPPPQHLDDEITRLSAQMGVRPLRAVIVQRIASPFVWCFGWLRLVWPESLLGEDDSSRSRGMIAHELAHLCRHDHWVVWLDFAAGLIWWWNPIFWFVRCRLRESAELACDALAIGALPEERLAYAEMFLELSSSFKSGTPVPVLGMSTGAPSSFERRLTMILSEQVTGKMSWRGIVLAGFIAALLAPSWSLGQTGSTPTPQPLTDFERRLLNELRQREMDVKNHETVTAPKTAATNGDPPAAQDQKLRNVDKNGASTERQVMLKVVVAEVNRAAAQRIGIKFMASKIEGTQVPDKQTAGVAAGIAPVVVDNGQLLLQIRTLRSLNFARSLAEPKLIAQDHIPTSFRTRTGFLSPILTVAAVDAQPRVTYVPSDLRINFEPHIADRGIRLAVTVMNGPRDLADTASQTVATTVELWEGQTMSICGLGHPGLGDALKQVAPSTKKGPAELNETPPGETELLVFVTPELVQPLPARKEVVQMQIESAEIAAYRQAVDARLREYRSGKTDDVDFLLDAQRRLVAAEMKASQSAAERVEIAQRAVERAKSFLELEEKLHAEGKSTPNYYPLRGQYEEMRGELLAAQGRLIEYNRSLQKK